MPISRGGSLVTNGSGHLGAMVGIMRVLVEVVLVGQDHLAAPAAVFDCPLVGGLLPEVSNFATKSPACFA